MSKLTAMQELIDYIQEMQNDNFVSDIEYIKDKAISKLEKEKQQIIEAHNDGGLDGDKMGVIYYETEFNNK